MIKSTLVDNGALFESIPQIPNRRKTISIIMNICILLYIIIFISFYIYTFIDYNIRRDELNATRLASVHFTEGLALGKDQQPQSARVRFQKALRLYEDLAARHPDRSDYRYNVAACCAYLVILERRIDPPATEEHLERATQILQQLCRDVPFDTEFHLSAVNLRNFLAYELLDSPNNPGRRDESRIVSLCDQNIETLKHIMILRDGGDSHEWFPLAQVYALKGDRDAARHWYEKAVQWMEAHEPGDETLMELRAEAVHSLNRGRKEFSETAVK
jgi:tetratricopeptide (TPR) repeat protein